MGAGLGPCTADCLWPLAVRGGALSCRLGALAEAAAFSGPSGLAASMFCGSGCRAHSSLRRLAPPRASLPLPACLPRGHLLPAGPIQKGANRGGVAAGGCHQSAGLGPPAAAAAAAAAAMLAARLARAASGCRRTDEKARQRTKRMHLADDANWLIIFSTDSSLAPGGCMGLHRPGYRLKATAGGHT